MATRTLSKINGRLRLLYRKQNFLDFSLRRLHANALIQPHSDHAWFPMLNKRLTKKIHTAQSKCIRFCLNLNNGAHVGIKEFKDINWLLIKERFEQCTATNVFKFFDNSAPPYMSEMFSPVGQGRITRRSKNKLNLPFRKTNTGQNGLSYTGPKIWNSLNSGLKLLIMSTVLSKTSRIPSLMIFRIEKIALIYIIKFLKALTEIIHQQYQNCSITVTFSATNISFSENSSFIDTSGVTIVETRLY